MRASLPRAAFAAVTLAITTSARVAGAIDPPPPVPKLAPPDPIHVEIGLRGGAGARASSSATIPIASRLGGVFGLGLGVAPSRRFIVGIAWERSSVGSEHGKGDVADVEVGRSLDMFWATVRLAVLRTDRVALGIELGPGLGIQRASASVLVYPAAGMRPTPFACSETGGPGFGLRAGIGAEVRLGGSLWLTSGVAFDHVQMSSGALGDCVPGVGSLDIPGARLGLIYRLDVTRWLR